MNEKQIKKIIPCLDFKAGRVVKGINFVNIKDAGDPVECALFYEKSGADELVFLDIAATLEKRGATIDAVEKVAQSIKIPLTVGGGIASLKDIEAVLSVGADRVSINSAAVKNPALLKNAVKEFSSEKIILAIDVKKVNEKYFVLVDGGTRRTDMHAVEWAKMASDFGVGYILPTSLDRDGAKNGYDIEITRAIAQQTKLPVIASGGAGKKDDFLEVLTIGKASAALAASLFHFREIEIGELKKYLLANGVSVKI